MRLESHSATVDAFSYARFLSETDRPSAVAKVQKGSKVEVSERFGEPMTIAERQELGCASNMFSVLTRVKA